MSKLREAEEEVTMKELVVADLRQSEADGRKGLAEALKLYDLVRTQRSRFVTLAQVSRGRVSEFEVSCSGALEDSLWGIRSLNER